MLAGCGFRLRGTAEVPFDTIYIPNAVTGIARELKRSLTAWDLTLLGIGAIIGTGIFVLTGTAAANQAGPAITMSF